MAVGYSGTPMKDSKSYLTKEQIGDIIKNTENVHYKRLFLFLALTGRRVSEVVRCLALNDIDFKNSLVNFKIEKRKEKDYRSLLPISEKALKILKNEIRENRTAPNKYIFPMSRQRADQIFKKASLKSGIEHVGSGKRNKPHVHLLRHSFAIEGARSLRTPSDLVQLKDMLAHARIETTMFYLKFNPTEKREMLKEMWK